MLSESHAYIIDKHREIVEMKKWYIILTVGLVLGYAGGAVVGPRTFSKIDVEEERAPVIGALAEVDPIEAAPVVDDTELKELRDQLAGKDVEIASLSAALDDSRLEVSQRVAEIDKLGKIQAKPEAKSWEDRRKEREERLEQWKTDNPEEYAEMEKRKTDFQDKVEGAIAEKSAFLVNLDTSGMSEEELTGHNELLGRIADGWEVMNNMKKGKFPSREDMGSMRENFEAIRDLYGKERDFVLRQTGKDLGYDEKGSADFSKHMQEVFEQTSASMPRGMWGGGGGRSHGGRSTQAKPAAVEAK